jgi:DNA repair photolyase
VKGRGASWNPQNRFEKLEYVRDEDAPLEDEESSPGTVYLRDPTRTIIATNDSPDVGFEASINPYRGCEHGCIYCFTRPTHEYLGFSAGLDFETKILVKEDAPSLLWDELNSKKWEPKTLAISGVTDPYQPIERKLRITRGCLEVLAEFRNPVGIITKNHLVTRDADVLSELASFDAARVFVSITTLDPDLARIMEPRTSTPALRLEALSTLSKAGVPVGVMVAPLFERWLEEHFPDRKEKVLNRMRDLRGGKLYDAQWGVRGRGTGVFADQIEALFDVTCRRLGLNETREELSTASFRRRTLQASLF